MAARKSLEDLKSEHINKTYNCLTVEDVYRDNSCNKWMFKCRCVCGAIINRQLNAVTSGHTNSCGCYKKSEEFANKRRDWCAKNADKIRIDRTARLNELRSEYVGKSYNYIEIIDVSLSLNENGRIKRPTACCKCKCGNVFTTLLGYVVSGHTKSCGCYCHSDEHRKNLSEYWRNNPEKLKERSKKRSQTLKENPDILKIIGEKKSIWCKNNPDKVKAATKKYKQWCKDNPEKLAEQGRRHSQYYKDNPDVLERANHKISAWYKNNPEKSAEKSAKLSQYYKDNPEAAAEKSKKLSQYYRDNPDKAKLLSDINKHINKTRRLSRDYSSLLDLVHPSYVDRMISGDIVVNDYVLTKCPLCGNYEYHRFGTLFIFKRNTFKYNNRPLCKECRYSRLVVSSQPEQEIANYISTFYTGKCIRNSKNVITPLELDLYYPEKKIAIEFNGDYWHSDLFKENNYHSNKFRICSENNILLISIFESDWNNCRDAIKSYIIDSFNNILNSLSYAEDNSYMNNNFPSRLLNTSGVIVEKFYYNRQNVKVYTCGESKIVEREYE